jgi:cell division protein FtsB
MIAKMGKANPELNGGGVGGAGGEPGGRSLPARAGAHGAAVRSGARSLPATAGGRGFAARPDARNLPARSGARNLPAPAGDLSFPAAAGLYSEAGEPAAGLYSEADESAASSAAESAANSAAESVAESADDFLKMEILMRKDRNKVRRKYALMVFVLFVFTAALIYRYTYVIELSDRIARQNAALAKIDGENSILQKQISMETDLEKIRLLAESRLNMQKPDKHQIIYIKVPKRDHALLEISSAGAEKKPFLESLSEQFQIIRERLFLK